MALETYLESNSQLAVSSMVPTRVTGGFKQSSSFDNLLQKDGHFQAVVASLLNSSSRNISRSTVKTMPSNMGLVSEDINPTILNIRTNSGTSVNANSLVTNAKLARSGGPNLQRSTSTNMEAYLKLPSTPMFSRSSVMDGSSIVRQTSCLDQNHPQMRKRKQQRGVTDGVEPALQIHRDSLLNGSKQEPCSSAQMCKKPRLDTKQEAILHQHIIQQLLESQDTMQLQGHNLQLQALVQEHKLRNWKQQEILQSIPKLQGVDMQQQQAAFQVSAVRPFDSGLCSRRLMQYIYHLRHRPPDNGIAYWRKFVAEYYAPSAKKRWCLSLYEDVGHHALGVFPQAFMDAWQCDLCGSKSGRGFEAIFDSLPRLHKVNFENGVTDEFLFLDLPHECRFPSGLMMLEYGKAVQETVYGQLRVVRNGQLRIVFTHDLKIFSWEFCARHHEELLPRSLVAPQIYQLVHAAQNYQSISDGSGSDGVSLEQFKTNCNTFLAAGSQLARNLELQSVDDLGFSKRFIRCLQIAEVVNSMKDLMTFSRDSNIGPIESLKNYSQDITPKVEKKESQEKEQLESAQGLPTAGNKLTSNYPSLSSNGNDSADVTNGELISGSEQEALALTSYYHKLLRQNSLNSNLATMKQEHYTNQSASCKPFQDPKTSNPGLIQNYPINGLSNSHSSVGSEDTEQHMIRKLLQEMVNNSRAANESEGEVIRKFGGSKVDGMLARTRGRDTDRIGVGFMNSIAAVATPRNAVGSLVGRINSFDAASSSDSPHACGNSSSIKSKPAVPEKPRLSEVVWDMAHRYYENGTNRTCYGNRNDMDYSWKT